MAMRVAGQEGVGGRRVRIRHLHLHLHRHRDEGGFVGVVKTRPAYEKDGPAILRGVPVQMRAGASSIKQPRHGRILVLRTSEYALGTALRANTLETALRADNDAPSPARGRGLG
jgi:hypothetical protein